MTDNPTPDIWPARSCGPVDAARRLRDRHPIRYRIEGEVYLRCPECEQWSPCDVRELMHAVNPSAGYLTDKTIMEWPR